jgi:hypothetical protein
MRTFTLLGPADALRPAVAPPRAPAPAPPATQHDLDHSGFSVTDALQQELPITFVVFGIPLIILMVGRWIVTSRWRFKPK